MTGENKYSNNLFEYATSELSQDAFIAWFLSHLMEANRQKDQAITKCAADFMARILGREKSDFQTERIDEILLQYKKIDVLVIASGKYIIIEDKTFTSTHGNQIPRYKEQLVGMKKSAVGTSGGPDEVIDEQDVICVYYKIIEQSAAENNVDVEFGRTDMIGLMSPYYEETGNAIFRDYYDHLKHVEEEVNLYITEPHNVQKWSSLTYAGLFKHLQDAGTELTKREGSFHYVSNPTGGFMCFLWDCLAAEELEKMGIRPDTSRYIYLQLENNQLAVKLEANEDAERDKVRELRRQLFEYCRRKNSDFRKKTFRYGRWMTVGYIEYDGADYAAAIEKMEKLMDDMVREFRCGQ